MNFASVMADSQPIGDNLTPDAQNNSMQTNLAATNPNNLPAA